MRGKKVDWMSGGVVQASQSTRKGKKPRQARQRKKRPDKATRQKQYGEYLESDRWKEKRDRIMQKAGGKCRFCGKPAKHVHHETYKRRGREKDVDLTAVCDHCHAMLHRKYDQRNPRLTSTKVSDSLRRKS